MQSRQSESGRERATLSHLWQWVAPWLPAVCVAAITVSSWLRTGVEGRYVAAFCGYWCLAILVPGLAVARGLIGVRPTWAEDLATAGVTGVSLEIVSWQLGVHLHLGPAIRFWWIPLSLAAVAVPPWRRRVFTRVPDRFSGGQAVLLGLLASLVIVRLLVRAFESAPLPPRGGQLYVDHWWQLALVQELMKYQPPQWPQFVGVPLNYHYFANLHIASAAAQSGVPPEVVLLRLWLVPVTFVMLGLAVGLGRTLTSSVGAGIATAWLAYGIVVTHYLWPTIDAYAAAIVNPIVFPSPSQSLSNTGLVAAAIGILELLRRPRAPGLMAWTLLISLGASGEKSTVLPILMAGTAVALIGALVRRRPERTILAGVLVALVGLEFLVLQVASGNAGARVTLLGSVRMFSFYRLATGDDVSPGINHGLVLDSIDSPRAALFAALAMIVLVGFNAVRLAGVVGLARRRERADLANWWLAGAVGGGLAAMLVIDHIARSQIYFAAAAGQLGAALTIAMLWRAAGGPEGIRWSWISYGLAAGALGSLLAARVVGPRADSPAFGGLEAVLLPVAIAGVVFLAAAGMAIARTTRRVQATWVLALAAVIGVQLPTEASDIADVVTLAVKPVVYSPDRPVEYTITGRSADVRTRQELTGLMWLRAHSRPNDVIMTNVHCLGRVTKAAPCDARGFWVVGLSGRRAVLEGWGYSAQSQARQGVNGLVYADQPAPYRSRFALNEAVFKRGDVRALRQLRGRFHVRWIVAVHAAGSTQTFKRSVARVRYENADITILEVS